MKNKLVYIKTEVTVKDQTTGNTYRVVFSGSHGDLLAVLFKNDTRVQSFRKEFGHANKSAALLYVKHYIEQNN